MEIVLHKQDYMQENIVNWFKKHQRKMPWRETKDPYSIWVSEIMLQQTQVITVIPYYLRFIKRFPNIETLAESDIEEVLRYWSGLGYYSRARNLQESAKIINAKYQGIFPEDPQILLKLPGIGRYTSGAIRSIAFGDPAPILDGNVIRVLSRFFAVQGDPVSSKVRNLLWKLAEKLVSELDSDMYPGDFNQGMMELGALVCTPLDPECPRCPIYFECEAHQKGLTEKLPETKKRPVTQRVQEVAAIIRDEENYLIARRPSEGLWGGLWEFPRGRCLNGEDDADALHRVLNETLGVEIRIGDLQDSFKHSVMHYSINLKVFEAVIEEGEPISTVYPEIKWYNLDSLKKLPFSAPQNRIIKTLLNSLV